MFNKIKSLERINKIGLNVHRYFIVDSISELKRIANDLGDCTIRTDHKTITEQLPFYVIKSNENNDKLLDKIWAEAQVNGYKLIISDGIKYDSIQEYNLVVKLSMNGDFVLEASPLKVPLRHMYRYPMLGCYGNIKEEVSEWCITNNLYGLDRVQLKHDLEYLYTYEIFNKWLEVTKYPIPVGLMGSAFVFWQIN